MHPKREKKVPQRPWLQIIDESPKDMRVAPPVGGIPEQKLPALTRLTLQCFFYPFMRLDLMAQALLRLIIPPPYKKVGQCKMSGKCCRYLGQEKSRGFDWPFFRWWAFEVNGFYERNFEVDGPDATQMRVYSCRHLTAQGTCSNYALRPTVCRTWPRIDYFGQPSLMKGCGYRLEQKTQLKKDDP